MEVYYIIHKPFGMLSQFTKETPDDVTLSQFNIKEKDVYPLGRLDKDSEGLLILTNDKKLNDILLNPKNLHSRSYWVLVEGVPTEEDIFPIKKGLKMKDYTALPAAIEILKSVPNVADRVPPVRVRKTIQDSWISITLSEGKNRQVRKMTAAIGFPTLRLVRYQIEELRMDKFIPNHIEKISKQDLYSKLGLMKE